ncbi:MAG: Rossman fold protein, TIGR00730 family [Actinobacteria bacterium]|nr:Rossman fold protein, TIGR00730 family [Actinomycetota bacterium]
MVQSMVELFAQHPATIDLKITSAAIAEMSDAFAMFAPYRDRPKVTIFGSARTLPDDPLYVQARQVAEVLADAGWMVITGAGPGIMHAAMEGAGREDSIGVSIKLPFEQGANPIIAGDSKYVSMKYFFTRKLMLIVPIVFLDTPGDPYWETVHDFVGRQLVQRGLVSEADTGLYLVTEDCQQAADEITRFYANYDSLRYVGDLLVIRVRYEPNDEQVAMLNERFGHLCKRGVISRSAPLDPERKDADRLDLYRITFAFAKHGYGELRAMIDTLNSFIPADEVEPPVEAPIARTT